MASARKALTAATIYLVMQLAAACDTEHWQGCRVAGTNCICAYGCRSDYPFRSRVDCVAAYREQNRNICSRAPCARGNCLQISQDPGFSCRCEGTGFYGHRCEKACPTAPVRGFTYPVECIVI